MTQFEIQNLRLRTIIGVNEWEREKPQDIIISIRYKCDVSKAETTDNLEDTFNYKTLTKRIIKEVENSNFRLLEALVNFIYKICKEDGQLKDVRVKVEKPNALRYCDNVIAIKYDNYEENL